MMRRKRRRRTLTTLKENVEEDVEARPGALPQLITGARTDWRRRRKRKKMRRRRMFEN